MSKENNEMNEIIEVVDLAEQLGKAIAESPASRKLREARKAMEAQPATLKLLHDYRTQSDKIAAMEETRKPVEVNDKHRLAELHDKLVSEETFKKYTAAQVDYVDLMRRVNDALRRQLSDVESEAGTNGN